MRIISISTDRKIWEEGSVVRARMIEYGTLFDFLHIIVFSKKKFGLLPAKISDRVWIYPTNSNHKLYYVLDAIKIGKRIIGNSEEHISITAQDPFETGIAGWWLSRVAKSKLNIQIHTDFLNPNFSHHSFVNWIRVRIAGFILPKADTIRVVSERIKQTLKENAYKLKNDPVVLPISIDKEAVTNSFSSPGLRTIYPQFSHIILMASRLTKEKNIGLAIDAMKLVVVQYPDAGLVIVGNGPEEQKLKSRVGTEHLEKNIVFEPWLSPSTLASYYKTADIFLCTSLYEGYGLALAEASLTSVPIVSTPVGISTDIKATVTDYTPEDVARTLTHVFKNLQSAKSHPIKTLSKEKYLEVYRNLLL